MNKNNSNSKCNLCFGEEWLNIPGSVGYGQQIKYVSYYHLVPCPNCNDVKIQSESELEMIRCENILEKIK